jgi:hypothetical protein
MSRLYDYVRRSTDDRWHIVEETPCCIATPDGGITVAWSSNDGLADGRAEAVAAEIVAAMNAIIAEREKTT